MSDRMSLLVNEDGSVSFVHDDRLIDIFEHEEQETRRASHVEPATAFGWDDSGWLADMRPVGGPLLHDGYYEDRPHNQKRPFRTRQQALDAERAWLRKERGL